MSDATVEPQNITTPNLGLNKPLVGGDEDIWGGLLNANCDVLDTQIAELRTEVNSLSGALLFIGTYDVVADYAEFSGASGFPNGPLPPAGPANFNSYLITTTAGTGHGNAPPVAYNQRDWLVSDGVEWVHLALGTPAGGVIPASTVTVTPAVQGQTNVQSALQQLDQLQQGYLPLIGGVLTGPVRTAAGTTAAPALQIGGADAGFWKFSASMMINAGSTNVMQLSATAVTALMPVTLPADPTANLQAATKQYVDNKASVTNPVMNGTAAVGTFTTLARADHVHPSDTSRAAQSSLANYLPLSGGTLSGVLVAAAQGITYGDGHTFKFTWNGSQVVASVDGSGAPGALLPTSGGTINGGLTVTAGLTSTGGNTFCNAIYFGYPQHTDSAMYLSGAQLVLQWQAGYSINWNGSGGSTLIYGGNVAHTVYDWQGSYTLQGGGGNLTLTVGGAWKPGGGTWGATSDERVKRNIAPYKSGLAEVLQLRPIGFEYNGLGDTPDNGRTYYGLSAQATREVMPELVHEMPDPVGMDGVRLLTNRLERQLGTELGPLTLALVNAVQELAAQVAALQPKPAREA